MRILFTIAILLMMAGSVWAEDAKPTTAELEWHIKALEADMARMLVESQLLQVKFNAAQAELGPLTAERDKRKAEEAKKAEEKPPPAK